MRARLVLLCAIAAAGCTRPNPAFGDPAETEAQADGSSEADTELDSETEAEVDDSAEQDTGMVCELQGGEGMFIEVPPPCPPNDLGPNAGLYDRWFKVVDLEANHWSVENCDANCVNCEDLIPAPLVVEPVPVGELAGVGACLRVSGRRLGDQAEDCEYHTLLVQVASGSNNTTPVLLARNTSLLEVPKVDAVNGPGIAAFNPALVVADDCPCADFPDDCCDGTAPTLYEFDIGQAARVGVGEVRALDLDQHPVEFWALDAFQPGECGEPLQVAWALMSGG
ncbi:hypothetical protein ENSA5_57000 [Enhygromyxa salina]|uniref:Lipoprotein n=1 Tax=Enhygromyxa salina TaxID=215803 RepID=A0A2S9XEE1_9BACT|nr:hypothetical protein [Enhygromyxa salina]PRP91225.1 hypothetical protein ENSA5_57000 [Enhygromyxa salina]